MKINRQKLFALIRKDFSETLVNRNLYIYAAIPILFSLLLRFTLPDGRAIVESKTIMMLCLFMILSMMPLVFLCTIIIEEKEKNTVRTLKMASVSYLDYVFSKAVISSIYTLVISAVVVIINRAKLVSLPLLVVLIVLVMLILSLLAMSVGLLFDRSSMLGLLTILSMLLFMVIPMFSMMFEAKALNLAARFIPTTAISGLYWNIYMSDEAGPAGMAASQTANGIYWGVLIGWLIISAAVFVLISRKKDKEL